MLQIRFLPKNHLDRLSAFQPTAFWIFLPLSVYLLYLVTSIRRGHLVVADQRNCGSRRGGEPLGHLVLYLLGPLAPYTWNTCEPLGHLVIYLLEPPCHMYTCNTCIRTIAWATHRTTSLQKYLKHLPTIWAKAQPTSSTSCNLSTLNYLCSIWMFLKGFLQLSNGRML